MPIEDIRMNILTNAKRIPSTITKRCKWNDEEVAIVSAGPSLKKNLEDTTTTKQKCSYCLC